MKKIFTILCLMALTMGAQAQQTYTFNWNNGSASLYDASGGTINSGLHAKWVSNVSPGVTIEVVEGGNSKKLMNTNGRIIINSASETNKIQITAPDGYVVKSYTLKFTGLSADSKTITPKSGGNAQTYTNNQVTVTATGIDQQSTYFTMAAASGSWVMSSVQTFSIVIEEVIENAVSVTYKVVDENGTTLTTKTESVTAGTSITSLPASMQHTLFYDYSTENYTAAEGLVATFTATPKESAPFMFTADATNPVWYFLELGDSQCAGGGPNYLTYSSSSAQNVTLPLTNADDETTQWAFIGNPYGFKIVNNAAGTSLVLGSAATAGSASNGQNVYATLQSENSQPNETWTIGDPLVKKADNRIIAAGKNGFLIYNTEGHALNKRNGTSNISYWTNGADEGSTIVATKVPEPGERYQQLIALLETYPYGTGLNQYSLTLNSEDKTAQAGSLISDLKAAGYTAENYTQAQAIQAGISLNMPKAKTFLRIRSTLSDQAYLKAADAGATMTFSTTADASTIFCYIDGKLVAYNNGLAANNVCNMGVAGGAASKFTFVEGLNGTPVTYSLYESEGTITDGSVYLYSRENGGNADRGPQNQTGWYNNFTFTLEEVTELPITLNSVDGTNYFATFSAPVAVRIEGATLNNVTPKANSISYKAVNTNLLPANTGVLLTGESGSATAYVVTDEVADAGYGLQAYDTALAVEEDDKTKLFLGKNSNDKVGFYRLGSAKTNGFKAYFANPSSGEAKGGFDLVNANETTGVESIDNSQLTIDNAPVYNLQGQRVNKAQKGVFIQNGKKVVVK